MYQINMSKVLESVLNHLTVIGVNGVSLNYNFSPQEYESEILKDPVNKRSELGAIAVKTGKFTGRSPKDRYIVNDSTTANVVDWGDINQGISTEVFDSLKSEIVGFLSNKTIFVQDAYACADDAHRLNIRTVAEKAYSGLFASNMFRNLTASEVESFSPEWTILCAPSYLAIPENYEGLKNENFAIINFSSKEIIIGGTGYTGEIKKGIFSVLNCNLALHDNVLPMHCSANVSHDGESAIFFGLSGTGKTTLSADPERLLIGDDEHGWSQNGVFNFEGGCYAKTIKLSKEGEPQIYNAIKPGALLENIGFFGDTDKIDFEFKGITENTRVSYPLEHIPEAKEDSKAGHPKNIFFLTCDAFGILPPVSKLTKEQAMYYFISGYTAKIAGTELGITEPQATFSACFGAPFLPLQPTKYAEMLGEKMEQYDTNIWLVNTGWVGGSYGEGNRISLKYTRSIISAALNGSLINESFENLEGFNLEIPTSCENVPSEVLNPRKLWLDPEKYDEKATYLSELFRSNFKKYEQQTSNAILSAQPNVLLTS